MPNCRTCNPVCQRCHKKPGFVLPVECPTCGRYNPADRDRCLKCGAPVKQGKKEQVTMKEAAPIKKACFLCDPLKKPLCKECIQAGRIKVCPKCNAYVLGTRKDCKACGLLFEPPPH